MLKYFKAKKKENKGHTYYLQNTLYLGRHCCLWCLSSEAELQLSKQERQILWIPERTLENLKAHLTSFQESGSDPKRQKRSLM